jgi:hypothetical protein
MDKGIAGMFLELPGNGEVCARDFEGATPARSEEFVGLDFSTMRRVDWALVSAGV